MSATRTQVYLTPEQRRRIDEIASEEGVAMAVIVRRALDRYLRTEVEPTRVLAATFGAAAGATVPSRDEWDRG